MLKLKTQEEKIDKVLLLLTLGLTAFGVLMIFEASSVIAQETFGDKFYLMKSQLLWSIFGIVIMIILSKVHYHFWKKISFFLFLISIFLLFLVLVPGLGLKLLGGRRWLNFFGFVFQPAELAKISIIIYFSSFFEKKKGTLRFLFLIGVITILLMLEPDLGTTVIIVGGSLLVYFLSGANLLEIFLFLIFGFFGGLFLIFFSPYRLERLKVFLNPNLDPQGSSYHLRQVILALGSGGIWGRGLGQSRQKFLFLPEAATDSIFAVIAEEIGFTGTFFLLCFFLFFFFRGLKISQTAQDKFGHLLAGGITGFIFVQTFLNLGSMVSLLPLTGVPLPFISYGGSSLVVILAGVGILLNISKFRLKSKSR